MPGVLLCSGSTFAQLAIDRTLTAPDRHACKPRSCLASDQFVSDRETELKEARMAALAHDKFDPSVLQPYPGRHELALLHRGLLQRRRSIAHNICWNFVLWSRACPQLSRMSVAAQWMPARKFRAVLS